MKKLKRVIPIILALALIMALPITANAAPKKYKASKVTAKQIVKELRKTGYIKKSYSDMKAAKDVRGGVNFYKSKYSFIDKKYKKVYCTVEVFRNRDDAIRRAAYIDTLEAQYATFGWKEDIPLSAYQYKNIVLRVNTSMPAKRAIKYYNIIKSKVK